MRLNVQRAPEIERNGFDGYILRFSLRLFFFLSLSLSLQRFHCASLETA